MTEVKNPLDPEVLSRISGLQLRVNRIVEGFITGLHKSPYHGFSVEFAQHRQYNPGDDIRYIDWKVFGKTDRFFIKEYEEETNMRVSVMVDCSESMKFSSGGLSKYEYGSCIAATLSYILLAQQDSVGMTLFDSRVRGELSPSTSPGAMKNIIRILEDNPPEGESRIEEVFLKVLADIKRRGMVIIISDLFVDPEAVAQAFKQLASRGHAVLVFHVLDRAELEFDFDLMTLFKGLENKGDILLNPHAVRKAYLNELDSYMESIKRSAILSKVNYFPVDTSKPLDVMLSSVLAALGGGKRS